MATFIHTGDWCLAGHPAVVSDDEMMQSLQRDLSVMASRIGKITRDHRADFVLVVGDVFHTASPDRRMIRAVLEAIASISLPVLIVPRDLDEGDQGSIWEQEFFIREAKATTPNLRVLLTTDPVDQSGCLLVSLLRRGDLRNPRDVWADARKKLAPGDPRPRIVIVPATGEVDEHCFRPSTTVADADLADIDYVAASGEKALGHVAVVTAIRGRKPVVEAVPSGDVTADALHGHALLPEGPTANQDSQEPEEYEHVLCSPCAAAPAAPPPTDDNVQFTVFRPQVVAPAKWYDLVAAAHLDAARPTSATVDPSPLDRVYAKAQAILGDRFESYAPLTQDALQSVPQGGQLTFAFEMAGVEFNPTRASFGWWEDEHTVHVRLRAAASLEGKTARGRMTVFHGAIILADVPFSLRVDATRAASRPQLEPEREAVRRYRRIFASYSHRDLPIVEQFEAFVEATGDRYLRDHKVLRAGEAWDDRLLELIAEADVFQLFWSRNAMASPHVRREWEHALSLGRENFIRPVYWESPLPQTHGLPPEPLTRIHFQFLGGIDATPADHAALTEAAPEAADADCGDGEEDCFMAACPAAAADSHSGPSLGSWRGVLVGISIGMLVVSIVIGLVAVLFAFSNRTTG